MLRSGTLLLFSFILTLSAAGSSPDLDVDLDPGRPYDFIKTPSETPTGGRRPDTDSQAQRPDYKPGKGGETVVEEEEKKKQPPPAAPFGLPGSKVPATADWKNHVAWSPKDDLVEWEDEDDPGAPTPTGPSKDDDDDPSAKKDGKDIWDMSAYPPKVDMELYVYCLTRFMQVQLHAAQVSWEERTQFLLELGYPGYYASTAVKNEGDLKKMSGPILRGVGPMIKTPPKKPASEYWQRVYMDLVLKYPYQPNFCDFILSEPSGKTLPVLMHILKNEKHPFLLRNAVFILRCFNNREIVDPLMALLEKTKDQVIRNRCIIALARWGPPRLADWCAKRMRGNDGFRTLAVWAIGRISIVSPISDNTVDKVMKAARANIGKHGEFLLSAIPSLGQIGRYLKGDKKDKIEKLLLNLMKVASTLKNPPSRGGDRGQGMNNVRVPDEPGVRGKILTERIKMALAMMGRAAEVKWINEKSSSDVHITSRVLFDECKKIIANKW